MRVCPETQARLRCETSDRCCTKDLSDSVIVLKKDAVNTLRYIKRLRLVLTDRLSVDSRVLTARYWLTCLWQLLVIIPKLFIFTANNNNYRHSLAILRD